MELTLLKFSAQWCGPCKAQKNELEKNPININVKEIDIDSDSPEEKELMDKFKIRNVPTIIIIDDMDRIKARFTGFTLSSKIKESISNIQNNGRFVVIEDFNDTINLIVNPDTGKTLVFNTLEEANEEAKNCQNGIVVKLN